MTVSPAAFDRLEVDQFVDVVDVGGAGVELDDLPAFQSRIEGRAADVLDVVGDEGLRS